MEDAGCGGEVQEPPGVICCCRIEMLVLVRRGRVREKYRSHVVVGEQDAGAAPRGTRSWSQNPPATP